MNPQFQTQDLLQQQPQLQEIPANLLKVQQYQQQQQQQQQLFNSPQLQQRLLQRQMYNQQVLTGQNSQLQLQLQYQLQQQYQQQQLQRIQLIQKKQAQQGIIVGQDNTEQSTFSNQLLLQAQQNQLLQQQSQILQQSPQQLPQSLLLETPQTNIITSQQLLQNNPLGPTTILNQSPTLNAKQSLLQQQLAQQQKLNLVNQSPIQTQNNLKTATPQLQNKIQMPTSTATTSTTNTIPTPTSQPQNLLKNSIQTATQAQIAEIQSQLTKQSSLVNKIPTSAINLESLGNTNILSIPTSVNALNILTTTTPLPPSTLSLSSATTPIDTKALPITSTAITATTVPTTTTPEATSKITAMSPLDKSQTSLSLQLSHAQLQSQLAKHLKNSQKSPLLNQQMNTPAVSSKTQIQNLNQIKKPISQTSPTSILQTSLVNIPSSTITTSSSRIPSSVIPSGSSVAAVSLSKAATTPVTTTITTTASALATAEKTKRIPSSSINSITIPTPPTQPLNSTNLQNYQSLIQQQQKLNLAQLTNSQLQLTTKDLTLNNELEHHTSANDLIMSGLTDNVTSINKLPKGTPSSLNSESNKASKGKSSIDDKPTINEPDISTDIEKNKASTIKKEPITHINVNYNDSTNDDINKVLSTNHLNNNKINPTGSPINPTYQSNSLANPIFRQQPSTQNEKIISKGSFLLKFNHFFSVLTKETKYRDILFWKQFSNNYLSDKSKLIINLLHIKNIVLKRTIIPLFFDALAKSEINSLNISFGLADEKYPSDGSCILESKDSILIINYNGIQINWYIDIKVLYDKDGKQEIFELNVKDIKKLYESNPFYLKNNYPVLNEYGIPPTIKRFVEIYDVVNNMDDLMNCSIAWNIGPKATLSKYANQYKQDLNSIPLTINSQLNNVNKIEVNSPLLSISNSDSSTNAQNNYNTLVNVDMMPPPQVPSSTNSTLNSTSEIISNNLNKKRLATTTLSPTTNTINTVDINANSITVGNNTLNLSTTLNPTSLVSSVALNLPTSSSVLSNLAVSNAAVTALTNAGININTSSAAALTNAISAVNISNTSIPGLVSPLHMEISNEPKSKKMKINASPRQRKKKVNVKNRNF